MTTDLPESLVISLDVNHLAAVQNWWAQLTDEEQGDFIEIATTEPGLVFESMSSSAQSEDTDPHDWYEYVVNQDVRFYVDVANGRQTSHGWLTSFTVNAIEVASNAQIVSHILSRPGRE